MCDALSAHINVTLIIRVSHGLKHFTAAGTVFFYNNELLVSKQQEVVSAVCCLTFHNSSAYNKCVSMCYSECYQIITFQSWLCYWNHITVT